VARGNTGRKLVRVLGRLTYMVLSPKESIARLDVHGVGLAFVSGILAPGSCRPVRSEQV